VLHPTRRGAGPRKDACVTRSCRGTTLHLLFHIPHFVHSSFTSSYAAVPMPGGSGAAGALGWCFATRRSYAFVTR